jgi:hypothetical protein
MVEVNIPQRFGDDPIPPRDNAELRGYRHNEDETMTVWIWVHRK